VTFEADGNGDGDGDDGRGARRRWWMSEVAAVEERPSDPRVARTRAKPSDSEVEGCRGGRRMPGWRRTDAGVAAASAPLDCSCASTTGRGNAPVVLARGFLPRGK